MSDDINLNTATMRDVIARSVRLHPSLLVDDMRAVADIHSRFAVSTRDEYAAMVASEMARGLRYFANAIEDGHATIPEDTIVPIFGVAAKLQCIGLTVQKAIAARS